MIRHRLLWWVQDLHLLETPNYLKEAENVHTQHTHEEPQNQ